MKKLTDWLFSRLWWLAMDREPDIVIGGWENPYLIRWWLIPRNRFLNIYLHAFMRSDDDRALHDHPWANLSILLQGEYTEHSLKGQRIVRAGGCRLRLTGRFAHRIELHNGPCWTLFITGPKYREWGFLCPQGWRHWREFTSGTDGSLIGKGCE